jgi:hypothetical protein
MLALDPAFDEHNYGARSFRAFLALLPKRVQIVETSGPDIIVKLIEAPAAKPARTRTRKSLWRCADSLWRCAGPGTTRRPGRRGPIW